MQKIYKVEAKGSLWQVCLEQGCYSDHAEQHILFSGNSEEEVWHFIKIWADESMDEWSKGLMWNDEKHTIRDSDPNNIDWDWEGHRGVYRVTIKRAHVIYVNP